MKQTIHHLAAIIIWLSASTICLSQGISVNPNGNAPDPSAMLDVSGVSKGVLINRMTTAERDAIVSPAPSLLIYNTSAKCFEYWENGMWQTLHCATCPTPGQPGLITGSTTPCEGSSQNYSVNNVNGVTYTWTLPSGWIQTSGGTTSSITATAGSTAGNIQVVPSNACGNGSAQVLAVSPIAIVAAPAAGVHVATATQITWNWGSVSGATGYKYHTTNDYNSATDNGPSNNYTQSGLTCNTAATLYVWAYNSCGTSAATPLSQSTSACVLFTCGNTLTDARDSQTYPTVLIGSQCWMAKNLNYDQSAFGNDYCYNNDNNNCTTYGRLYDWAAAMQGASSSNAVPSGVQGVCPTGWHLPSDAEWCQLENYLEPGIDASCSITNWRGTSAGGSLKQSGTSLWLSPNTGGTNTSGFTGLPGGSRDVGIGFFNITNSAYFQVATEVNGTNAWRRALANNAASISRNNTGVKTLSSSVRCVLN